MFTLWLVITFLSNLMLSRSGSNMAIIIVCLLLYAFVWILFMRADILEYLSKSKTPLISLCITMFTFWAVAAFISVSGSIPHALLTIRGILLLLLIYFSAPVAYLFLALGETVDYVAQSVIPIMFGFLLLIRLMFLITYKRTQQKND